MHLKNSINASKLLYFFIFLHVSVWTLFPSLIRFTPPLDSMEGATWGHQLEWGYDKNPFLNGWLTHLAVILGGTSGWMIYLFSQLSVALCFWASWQLGKKILSPTHAAVAVLLMVGMQYYNFHAIDFNDNTLELGLWALTILFFYEALTEKKILKWILTGITASLGMMAKYYTVMLLAPMLLFLCFNASARMEFKKPGLYYSLAIFTLISLPHFIWLFSHNFVTLHYAFNRVSAPPTWLNHLSFPLEFAWQQLEVFLPSLILFCLLLIGKKPAIVKLTPPLSHFNKSFLLIMGLGPFILTVLLSAIAGLKLRAGWGQPLLSLWMILLFVWVTPNLTTARVYRALLLAYGFLAAILMGYTFSLTHPNSTSSANYPGKIISSVLTQEWQNEFHTPVAYIAGARWVSGNIAFYSPTHPAVYINWNHEISPWINEAKLKQQGAIFVWDPEESNQASIDEIRKRFPHLQPMQTLHFAWLRGIQLPIIEINAAFLPPQPLTSQQLPPHRVS